MLREMINRRVFLGLTAAGAIAWPSRGWAVPKPAEPRRLRLVNAHTGEKFDGFYRNDKGPIARVIDELNFFLRDFHSGEKIQIDVGVLDFLGDMLAAVGETNATILSAYRTRETNEMLMRTTFGVAENSQHIFGRALDVHIGSRLGEAMAAARAMQRGGVGWYPHSGFIHIDTGPVRNWTLDEGGLDNLLLFDGSPLRIAGRGRSIAGGARRPLSVSQRLSLQRQLARAEFIARRHY
jgi:uncharacterized protein YcbK (DUF882 family)